MHFTSLVFPGNPHHRQSAIHLDDLVEVFQLLIIRQNEIPEKITLSVAEDETPDYEELQKSISLLIHKKELPIISVPKLFAKSGAFILSAMPSSRKSFIKPWMIKYSDANYDIDNTRLKTLLDWHPVKNLRGTLHLIIANLIKYPGTWYRINKIPRPPIGSVIRTKILKDVLI
jgi:nucleoside-diphosphate-sugar epimerase